MKRLIAIIALALSAVTAFAQTPEEILARMEDQFNSHENDGIVMTAVTKVPILGTMVAKTWSLGEKLRMETEMMGVKLVTWTDGVTDWTYTSKDNTLVIKNADASTTEDAGDAELFGGITDGYDVSIKQETDQAWYIACKKSKSNPNKDDPKTMEVVVAKGTYHPISLSAKSKGISILMRDISFGVSEDYVTFDPAQFPDAQVEDKR